MRRLVGLAVVVVLASPGVATGSAAAWGVAVRAKVNPDHSVRIEWRTESAEIRVTSLTVDSAIVSRSLYVRTLTTRPLLAGSHMITIEALETFVSYSDVGSSCEVVRQSAHWLCHRDWRRSVHVYVPSETKALCVAPSVVGLQLKAAEGTIAVAKCSLGAVKTVTSHRVAGTVLVQRPKPTTQLDNDTEISLVVSRGPR